MYKKRGLTSREAEKKLKKNGLNEIKDVSKRSNLKILFRQIKSNFVLYFLMVAVILSFIVGKNITAYTIIFIILLIIVTGFIQEYKAEKSIDALKSMLVPFSLVVRDGKEKEIKSVNLVPGDVVILRSGEKVPADCLLLEQNELRVNEAVLTGESVEVVKKAGSEKKFSKKNLVFMGTYIVNGRCVAKVLKTGMNTKFGNIAGLISSTEKDLPLQKKVNNIVKYLIFAGIFLSVLTGLIMVLRSSVLSEEVIINIFILVIAMAVAAFPESFPLVLITTLATGAYHMAKKNAIVNRMSIIETLGETTVICSDKTGTITKGEMTVKKIFAKDLIYDVSGSGYESEGDFFCKNKKINAKNDPVLKELIYNAVLCNDSIIEISGDKKEFKTIGSPTESALLIMGVKAGLFREDIKFKRIKEIPFSSERKMMSILCSINKENIVYSKGAIEFIIKKCKFIQKGNKVVKLSEGEKKRILEANKNMTLDALRTIALAYKKHKNSSKNFIEDNLIFLGFVGIEDPAREEVKESIFQCHKAGIKVKMITGDNKETAISIAKDIGLKGKVMEGYELDDIKDDKLAKIIDKINIFARVNPEHKLRIVKALKKNGEIVTMTGDGVNDAPSLKEAHIGIAMGKKGTDVSRSVADLTLKDDNFNTIVSAIREGRTIFKNIRKFTSFQISCNFAELGILLFGVLLAPFFGWEIPLLLALQILFMNMVTADLPAIGLGLNRSSDDAMSHSPRRNSRILNKNNVILLVFTGSLMLFFVLGVYFFTFNILGKTHQYAQTSALFALIGFELVSGFNFRSFRKGVFNRSLIVNPYLFYASVISLAATLAIIYTPLNKIFETIPLKLDQIFIVIILCLVFVAIFDLLKFINNKKKFFDLEHI
jgi:P-type Ca2+ transporter type 2C